MQRGPLSFRACLLFRRQGRTGCGGREEREGWGGSPTLSLPLDPNIRTPLPIRPPWVTHGTDPRRISEPNLPGRNFGKPWTLRPSWVRPSSQGTQIIQEKPGPRIQAFQAPSPGIPLPVCAPAGQAPKPLPICSLTGTPGPGGDGKVPGHSSPNFLLKSDLHQQPEGDPKALTTSQHALPSVNTPASG